MKGKQIILLVLLVAGVAAIVLSLRQGRTKKPSVVGLYAPDFHVTDFRTGKTIRSADFKGKVVFVNFWASWCSPCKEEMPSVDALYDEMRNNKDFVMITILYRDTPVNAVSYMKSKGYDFPVYSDPRGTSAGNFGVTGVPETYVIDKNGVLQKKMIGPDDWTSPEERQFISSLLR
ncbi:MAG: TlpA disulfide reductase family protein [Candidatus Sulfobium sp.]|jgi:cytochrome c biogenesis protein CcmG/thiol:disulfide interchange protein DsbE